MPCMPFKVSGGGIGWACTTEERDPPRCYKCGAPAQYRCDYRQLHTTKETRSPYNRKIVWSRKIIASIHTCDRPMCHNCVSSIPGGLYGFDFCDEHFNEINMAETERAEKLYEKMLKELEGET